MNIFDYAPEGTEKLVQYEAGVYWVKKGFVWECAVECWEENDSEESGVVIATRPQTPRKTVADAYEYFGGVWEDPGHKVCCYADYGEEGFKFVQWVRDWIWSNGECYEVCTREEFEAYAKEQEGKKWTHEFHELKCRFLIDKPDREGYKVIVNELNEYYCVNEEEELTPIKPRLTKAKAWDRLNSGEFYNAQYGIDTLKHEYEIID